MFTFISERRPGGEQPPLIFFELLNDVYRFSMSDALRAFQRNDQQGMRRFYNENLDKCRRLVNRLGGSDDQALDVMQSAMLILFTNVRNGKYKHLPGAKFETYFLQICKFIWIDVKRSVHYRAVGSVNQVEDLELEDGSLSKQDILEMQDRQSLLEEFMRSLDERCKGILKAFYWNNDPLAEIAARFGLSAGSAKTQKYRCLQKLRAKMIKRKDV